MSQPYRQRSADTWDAARDAYLDGSTAQEVCDRFHLGLSAFRKRARQQAWRRLDQDEPEPEDFPAEEDLGDIDDQALVDLCFRHMAIEARRGRVRRALAWARLRDVTLRQIRDQARLQRQLDREGHDANAADAPAFTPSPPPAPEFKPGLAEQAIVAARELHKVHQIHSNSSFSRADRRRLAALTRKTSPP